jgi:uncharacterized protein (DUF58 family)
LPFGDAEGFPARLTPYRSSVEAGAELELAVEVRNPFAGPRAVTVRLVLPDGWRAQPDPATFEVDGEGRASFTVVPGGPPGRARVAADVTIGETMFGQQAEALVTVT